MARPRASTRPASKTRLLEAATAEFADRGFAGASVDRIARKAQLTKAMLYYHFKSKETLYREVIRTALQAFATRIEASQQTDVEPVARLRAFVRAFAEEAALRPEFPRMMMRELTEVGRHLDVETARAWVNIPQGFVAILNEGIARGEFRRVSPLLAYLAIVGPIILVLASAPLRERIKRLGRRRGLPEVDLATLSAEAEALAIALLAHPSQANDRSPGVTYVRVSPKSRTRRTPSPRRPRRGSLP